MSSFDERSPLLQFQSFAAGQASENAWNHHHQFCELIGIRPNDLPPDQPHKPPPESLYQRAVSLKKSQNLMYQLTASFSNFLILSQVVLGAALTGLGASGQSHILITIFGALNTIIAGLIGFIKARGQPMRARMFRDDLERVVDEIENSAIMWLGISKNAHGYDAIDIDDQVTVRGEVARLTRLYDKAVKTNTINDPDMYSTGAPGDLHSAALRDRTTAPISATVPAPVPAAPTAPAPVVAPAPAAAPVADDPDDSPATKPTEAPKASDAGPATGSNAAKPAEDSKATPADKTESTNTQKPAAQPQPPGPAKTTPAAGSSTQDPDESPATAVVLPQKHSEDTSKPAEEKK